MCMYIIVNITLVQSSPKGRNTTHENNFNLVFPKIKLLNNSKRNDNVWVGFTKFQHHLVYKIVFLKLLTGNTNKSYHILGKVYKSAGGLKRHVDIRKNRSNDSKMYASYVYSLCVRRFKSFFFLLKSHSFKAQLRLIMISCAVLTR